MEYLRKITVDWVNGVIMISGSSNRAQKMSAIIAISTHAQ